MDLGSSKDAQAKSPEVQQWIKELDSAREREKNYRKDARRVVAIYEAEKREDYQFNILYSNTETMLPALYNSTPRPDIQPRYKDQGELPMLASKVAKRTLEFLLDTDQADYSRFDDALTSAVLSALVPGRGVTRFKYDYTAEKMASVMVNDEANEGDDAGGEAGEGEPASDSGDPQDASSGVERVSNETICPEEVPWDRVHFGYCQRWKDLPWLAFEHYMTRAELIDNFGEEAAASIPTNIAGGSSEDNDDKKAAAKDAQGERLAQVYEIWDKSKREVVFISPDYGSVIRRANDPLKLKHFYPIPKPLSFFNRLTGLTPQTLYAFYEEQAKELNTCTKRINMIMAALKVRGFYDATLDGLDELMKKGDNTLMPAENVAAMLQGQTLDKAIWFFPIEKLVGVLQQLYVQREQVKQVIYEVTGISDIVRGANAASETATASNIKNQWGTIRLKRAQKEVQRYVKDCLRIMTELAFNHFSAETLAKMTGIELPTKAQQAQAQQMMAQMQQMAQAQPQQPPMPGQPPAPPAAPPVPPEQMQQIQSILSSPTWEDVLGMLSDDVQRDYRIDIEANSTIDADAQEDKADVADFMNAMGQFLSGVTPLVEQGMMPFPVMRSVLLAITQRYRFGREVEDQIKQMAEPQPKADPSEDAKAQSAQAQAQVAQQQAQADLARIQAQAQADQQELAGKLRLMQAEMEMKEREQQMKAAELNMKAQDQQRTAAMAAIQHQQSMEQAAAAHARALELADVQHKQAMQAARQPKGKP